MLCTLTVNGFSLTHTFRLTVHITALNVCKMTKIKIEHSSFTFLKVYGYAFRGSNSYFHFASHLIRGQFFREDTILGRLCLPGELRECHENCLLLKKWRRRVEMKPCTLSRARGY